MNSGPRVLVGACGAIGVLNLHAYLIRFREHADSINVIMTRSARRMIRPSSIRAFTGNHVYGDGLTAVLPVPHIRLAQWADLFFILPASANIIGKVANGIADDLLSTTIIAAKRPVYFVPSMNDNMWQNPAVQRNVMTLRQDGHCVVLRREPRATFEVGTSEYVSSEFMPSPEDLFKMIQDRSEFPGG